MCQTMSEQKSTDFLEKQPDFKPKNDNCTSNPVPKRMSPRQKPGVYMILCLTNNKRYYGETNNVSNRLSQHKSTLRRNIHPVIELQRDWNLYGPECFDFVALFMYASKSDNSKKVERQALELEYISRHYSLCYNTLYHHSRKKENNPFWNKHHSEAARKQIGLSLKEYNQQNPQGLPIMLDGVKYQSISQASRETKHSRDTIARYLKDPNNQRCLKIDLSGSGFNLAQAENQTIEKKQVSLAPSNAGALAPTHVGSIQGCPSR
jgi:hypothetical protein